MKKANWLRWSLWFREFLSQNFFTPGAGFRFQLAMKLYYTREENEEEG
jgi:hypothetical protein